MPTQCPTCKALNRDTAIYCDHCGSRLIASPTESTSTTMAHNSEQQPKQQPAQTKTSTQPSQFSSGLSSEPYVGIEALKVKPGIPTHSHARLWYLFWVLAMAGLGAFLSAQTSRWYSRDILIGAILMGGFGLLVGLPFVLLRGRPATVLGTVTHLREWTPQGQQQWGTRTSPNWLFDLRLTNKTGDALKDRKGFLLPILEVEMRSDKVHGPPLEEGCQVILRGKWKAERLRAIEIWNCSPGAITPTLGTKTTYWGQVTDVQLSSAPDMRYGGQRSLQVLSFRLQLTDKEFQLQHDEAGNILPPIPVEIRAQSISGPLGNGEKVEICGSITQGILYTKEVRNHSASGAPPLVVKEWTGIS